MNNNVPISTCLDFTLSNRLKRTSYMLNRSQSSIIREALKEYLKK